MIENPGILFSVLAFLCAIGPLVFIHEMGHYTAGRIFGIKADAFSIGFGREIAGWTDRLGTRWKIGWLPLGGYVKFAGDMNPASVPDAAWLSLPAAERERTFQAKPLWQRAIVVAAGPFVNLVLAVLILAGFAYAYGVDRTPAVIDQVAANTPAAAAGLVQGDRILAIDGVRMETFTDLAKFAMIRPGQSVTVTVLRGDRERSLPLTIGTVRQRDRFGNDYKIGRLGIAGGPPIYAPVSLAEAPFAGVRATGEIVSGTIETLGQIISGRRSLDELGGPIRIAKVSGEQMSLGWPAFVWLIALLSINLGFINLLPVPLLDGGHLLFYAVEAVRRRPLEPQAQEWAFRGGMAAVLLLMLVVTFNDLGAVGVWQRLAGLIG